MNPLLRLALLLELLWSAIGAILERLGQFFEELVAAFPNPIGMANAITGWMTSTVGIILGTQASQLIRLAREQVKKDFGTRLIKPEMCFRFFEFAWSDVIRTATNTTDAGLLEWATQTIVVWAWRTFKRWKKIWSFFKISNELELLAFVKKHFTSKFARIQAFFIAALYGLLILTFQNMFAAIFLIYAEDFGKFCLPQDSKRKTSHPKSVTRRQNRRAGPDQPGQPPVPPL